MERDRGLGEQVPPKPKVAWCRQNEWKNASGPLERHDVIRFDLGVRDAVSLRAATHSSAVITGDVARYPRSRRTVGDALG